MWGQWGRGASGATVWGHPCSTFKSIIVHAHRQTYRVVGVKFLHLGVKTTPFGSQNPSLGVLKNISGRFRNCLSVCGGVFV